MSMTLEGQMDSGHRSLHGTPIEFRIVYSVAFAGAVVSGLIGGRKHHGPLLASSRDAAWELALNTIPQTPFG